jgi:hypothetical protein
MRQLAGPVALRRRRRTADLREANRAWQFVRRLGASVSGGGPRRDRNQRAAARVVKRDMPTLHDILQSTSSALFPAELGHREVFLDSRDSDGDTALHVILRRKVARAVKGRRHG